MNIERLDHLKSVAVGIAMLGTLAAIGQHLPAAQTDVPARVVADPTSPTDGAYLAQVISE